MRNNAGKLIFAILILLVLLNILAWREVLRVNGEEFLEVTFFDVGQGDAIFIESEKMHQILIDGGPNNTILEKLAEEMPSWDRTIDLIVLTHPEHDHMRGLIEVLKRYEVENVLWTGVIREGAEYEEWKRLLEEERAKVYIAESNQRISAQDNSFFIDILYPFESLEQVEERNLNDTSIVARLVFKENSFLFTGDISKKIEEGLIEKKFEIDSDILKVGHHGSKTSTGENFIKEVSPNIAVIQCGKSNLYGHPHEEVLQNLEGIKVLRTDLIGDIKILSNGEECFVKN